MAIFVQRQHEVSITGRRLGRHVEHDERSRDHIIPEPPQRHWFSPIQTVEWTRRVPIFDQGDLGSCTGNAMAGALATDSADRQGETDIDEAYAVKLYELATTLDNVPGTYPPEDTGSSGLGVLKAARKLGKVRAYRHAFSLNAALYALQSGPVITGITWLTGCDTPNSDGLVSYDGYVRGGHEICVVGCDVNAKVVKFANSWGTGWGDKGYFYMSWDDYRQALRQGGDVTVPVFD